MADLPDPIADANPYRHWTDGGRETQAWNEGYDAAVERCIAIVIEHADEWDISLTVDALRRAVSTDQPADPPLDDLPTDPTGEHRWTLIGNDGGWFCEMHQTWEEPPSDQPAEEVHE